MSECRSVPTLLGLSGDPSAPGDGDIWYDTGLASMRARQSGAFLRPAVPSEVAFLDAGIAPHSGGWSAAPTITTAIATVPTTTGTMYLLPMPVIRAFTANSAQINVGSATAGSLYYGGVYSAKTDLSPNQLIEQWPGTWSGAATGVPKLTITTAFSAAMYWLAIVSNGTEASLSFLTSPSQYVVDTAATPGFSATLMPCAYTVTGFSGATLPTSPTIAGTTYRAPRILIRAA